ncbi:hypothetical protein PG985_006153 [Apiospora marii]|uniref:uncharacterized protein n=1 Tax=Apiospora marii TaxID=335849 RepID=UPI003131609E
MVAKYATALAVMSTIVAAGPVSSLPRAVADLNQAAFEEAQRRDAAPTGASSVCSPVTVTVTAANPNSKRNAAPDTVTKTELVYVTASASQLAEPSFSSTTTIFVTVGAAPSAPAGGAGGAGTIPQVSINPTTTVVMNPGNGAAAPTSKVASTTQAKAPAASAPAGGAAGGIPQVSINPTTTVVLNPGNGAGAAPAPAPTSSACSSKAAAPTTSAKAKAPASSAPAASAPAAPAPSAPAGAKPIQVSIGPSGTVTLNPGNGAAPAPTSRAGAVPATSAKANVPAPSAPAAGQPIPQVSISPTTTVIVLA